MTFETNNGTWLGAHKKQGLRKPHSDARMPRIKVCRVQCVQKGWGPGYKPFSPCPKLTEEISLFYTQEESKRCHLTSLHDKKTTDIQLQVKFILILSELHARAMGGIIS